MNGGDPVPRTYINHEKLTELLNTFFELTQIRITFWDGQGRRCVSACANSRSQYCETLQTKPGLLQECGRCEDEALAYAETRQNQLHSFRCHAGMHEFVYSVVYDGKILGHFMFGQVVIREEPQHPARRLALYRKHGLDRQHMESLYAQLPVLPLSMMHAAGKMLAALASYAYLNGLIEQRNISLAEELSQYINKNYHLPLTQQGVCSVFHISRSTLNHVMSQQLDTTFVTLVQRYRIENVKARLLRGESITQATYAAGFNSENYMTRVFKNREGITPSRFRALHAEK